MAQDNSLWNQIKQQIEIPLMADVGKTATVTTENAGIGGYELTIRENESITLASSITDYYAENNSSLQDNIALKPIIFTINGIVAEKYQDVRESTTIMETVSNALSPVLSFMPDVTRFIMQQITVIEAALNAISSAITETQNFINDLMGVPKENELSNQQKAFIFFYSAYKARELMEVSLPWCTINNCAIENVEITQPAETRTLSNIKISFKQMNFASTASTVLSSSIGRRKAQASKTPATNLSNVGSGSDSGSAAGLGARLIN